MCPECEKLREQVEGLKARVRALSLIIRDMSGPAAIELDNPYEDEQPVVRWGDDK
jgi:hypothetical protein